MSDSNPGERAHPLIDAFFAAIRGEIESDEAIQLADCRDLARATPISVDELVLVKSNLGGTTDEALLLFGRIVERHANALDEIVRSQEAQSLYAAIKSIFANHAPPVIEIQILDASSDQPDKPGTA